MYQGGSQVQHELLPLMSPLQLLFSHELGAWQLTASYCLSLCVPQNAVFREVAFFRASTPVRGNLKHPLLHWKCQKAVSEHTESISCNKCVLSTCHVPGTILGS